MYADEATIVNCLVANSIRPLGLDYYQINEGHRIDHCTIAGGLDSPLSTRAAVTITNSIVLSRGLITPSGIRTSPPYLFSGGGSVAYNDVLINFECDDADCARTISIPPGDYWPRYRPVARLDSLTIADSLFTLPDYSVIEAQGDPLPSAPTDFFGRLRPTETKVTLGAIERRPVMSAVTDATSADQTLSIAPNPVRAGSALGLFGPDRLDGADWRMYSPNGQLVHSGALASGGEIDVPSTTAAGVYAIVVRPRQGTPQTLRFVVMR